MSWISSRTPERESQLYFKVLQPAPQLRKWVRYYWVLKDDSRKPQIDEFLAPDGFEEIIFSYADGFRRNEVFGSSSREDVVAKSYVVGCKPYGVTCARTGQLSMIGVKLWPQVLHAFLRLPLHELSGRPLLLSDINSPVLNELESSLLDAENESQIKSTLDAALLQAIEHDFNDLLSFSIHEIFQSRGALTIDTLADRCGVHYRTLEKAFRDRIGLPPKTLAKILRFKHAFTSLAECTPGRHFNVADCGYYDQSHFCREFKSFTGRPPTQFFRDRVSVDVARFCLELDLGSLNHSASPAEFVL
jgi:AraC-like DNA-binding protein